MADRRQRVTFDALPYEIHGLIVAQLARQLYSRDRYRVPDVFCTLDTCWSRRANLAIYSIALAKPVLHNLVTQVVKSELSRAERKVEPSLVAASERLAELQAQGSYLMIEPACAQFELMKVGDLRAVVEALGLCGVERDVRERGMKRMSARVATGLSRQRKEGEWVLVIRDREDVEQFDREVTRPVLRRKQRALLRLAMNLGNRAGEFRGEVKSPWCNLPCRKV